jgi:drug/metabolite transporter (DMT)-like permease
MSGAKVPIAGPVIWFVEGLLVLSAVLALFVTIDSARPVRRERFAQLPEPWWLYTATMGVFLAFLLAVQTGRLPAISGAILLALVPFALAEQVAYLLRVVYPRPAENNADSIPPETDAE